MQLGKEGRDWAEELDGEVSQLTLLLQWHLHAKMEMEHSRSSTAILGSDSSLLKSLTSDCLGL